MIGNYFFSNSGAAAYEIERSLRFDGSSRLKRTPSTTGNRRKFTISMWIKRARCGVTEERLFTAATHSGSTPRTEFGFTSGSNVDRIISGFNPSGSSWATSISTPRYRDVSAWMHIVYTVDTEQATASNRAKVYINGSYLGAWNSTSYPSQNSDLPFNNSGSLHYLGDYAGAGSSGQNRFHGYMAEVHFLDGTYVNNADDFGETDANGVWIPKEVSGVTYGTNGFYLKFDPDATNGVGHDHSGQGNHWTADYFRIQPDSISYRGNWIGSLSGSTYSGDWENVFNGEPSVHTSFVYVYNQTSTCTFDTSLSGEIEVMASNGSSSSGSGTMKVSLSDGSQYDVGAVTRPNASWYSFGTKSGITSITITSSGGGNHGTILAGVRVGGAELVSNEYRFTFDDVVDSPTNNHCTLNYNDSVLDPTNGALTFAPTTNNNHQSGRATFGMTEGKWYWEVSAGQDWDNHPGAGIMKPNISQSNQLNTVGSRWYRHNGLRYYDGTEGSTWGSSLSVNSGDILGLAFDADAGKLTVYVNGTSQGDAFTGLMEGGSPNLGTTTSDVWIPAVKLYNGNARVNFGALPFAYTPPTGYSKLCTANLATPVVKNGADYFNAVLYNGNNSYPRSISGVGHSPDWLILKTTSRGDWGLGTYDRLRGVGTSATSLRIDSTSVEGGSPIGPYIDVDSFDSDGFTLGNTVSVDELFNESGESFVAWSWKANGSNTTTDTNGSINSTVSVSSDARFSIVTYTSPNSTSDQTVGHGLGVKPDVLIVKNRDYAYNWDIYHSALGYNSSLTFTGNSTRSGAFGAEPNDTVFTTKTSYTHRNTDDYVAYCFADRDGFFKTGSYSGNSGDQFFWCGFRPALIIIKATNYSSRRWEVFDSTINTGNPATTRISFSEPTVATDYSTPDFVSNGFTLRGAAGYTNDSGTNYIWMAWAENPFGGDGVAPATAR